MLDEVAPSDRADVTIVRETIDYLDKVRCYHADDIDASEPNERYQCIFRGKDIYAFEIEKVAIFIIEDSKKISVIAADCGIEDGMLATYILGGCMGYLLQQRGMLLIHGSCVAKDDIAIVIMGWCGAGKSTTAREFLRRGWKLVTDDVTAVDFSSGRPRAIPSYPSQKLWADAIDHYDISRDSLTPLWQEERREKFHVAVEDSFCSEKTELKYALWLIEGPPDCELMFGRVDGFAKVDRFMKNMYAFSGRSNGERDELFQQCVDLADGVSMFECLRPSGKDCAGEIYDKVTALIEDTEKDS